MKIGDIEKIGDREIPVYVPPKPGAPIPTPAPKVQPVRREAPQKQPAKQPEKV